MKKFILFLITIICYSSIQSQPIRFNRMYNYNTIGVGNCFNQISLFNGGYVTFGYYSPYIPGLPTNFMSVMASATDSLGNLTNWYPYLDTIYNHMLSGWSSDIKTNDGGYIVSGYASKRSNSINHGFLMKLDSNLNMQWRRYYADTDPNTSWLYRDYAFQSLKITPDKGYIAVGIRYKSGGTSCGLAVKFDSLGNEQWVRTYNLNYYMSGLNTVVVVPDGYILGGAIWTTSDNNTNDNIVTKIDTAGNVLWQKTLGGIKGGEWVILHNYSDTNIMVFQTKSDSAYIDSYGDYMTFPKIHFYKISNVTGNTIWDLSYDSAKYARMCFSFRIFSDGSALACGTQFNNWYPWIIHLNSEGGS